MWWPLDRSVERDLHFTPKRRLSEYMQRARADGSIND
jgi:hypothetical protein